MWALIVMSIMAGSATAKNSMPIVYSGVQITTGFESKKSCEDFKAYILEANKNRNSGAQTVNVQDGIISVECKKQ